MDGLSWNRLVAIFPNPHLLQTAEWAQVKAGRNPARAGWEASSLVWDENQKIHINDPQIDPTNLPAAACLVLRRKISAAGLGPGFSLLYAPKGPLLRDWGQASLRAQVLRDLEDFSRAQNAIFTKIDPDLLLGTGLPSDPEATTDMTGEQFLGELRSAGWHFSAEQVQFRNTVLVDLTASEDELLARMKPKTRYNIRLAVRKGVTCRAGGLADLGLLYRMYAETSVRDGFVIRQMDYYLALWRAFMENRPGDEYISPIAEPLIAEVAGEPVAALVIFRFARRAWYLHGMSRAVSRELMPNYLLQWEAMRRAKAAGCKVYDLWGAPDSLAESDPLWGVYRFKQGFGGVTVRTMGAWDLPLRPFVYRFYTQALPRLLEVMRNRGRKRTRDTVLGS